MNNTEGVAPGTGADGEYRPRSAYRGERGAFRGGDRGGRGRGRGRGGAQDTRNKRDFDRQSGSDKSGVKPIEKREGSGAHNWGSVQDEIEGQLEPAVEEVTEGEADVSAPGEVTEVKWVLVDLVLLKISDEKFQFDCFDEIIFAKRILNFNLIMFVAGMFKQLTFYSIISGKAKRLLQ